MKILFVYALILMPLFQSNCNNKKKFQPYYNILQFNSPKEKTNSNNLKTKKKSITDLKEKLNMLEQRRFPDGSFYTKQRIEKQIKKKENK